MLAVRFFSPKIRGLYIDKEPSNDSVAGVRSETKFTSAIAAVKFTAGQVTQNTKWPIVRISFLKRIEDKVHCMIIHLSSIKNDYNIKAF